MNEKQQLILLAAVFSLVLIGEGALAYLSWSSRTEAMTKLAKLDREEREARQKFSQIPDLEASVRELAGIIEEYVEILPTDAEVSRDAFLEDVDGFTKNTGLKIVRATPVEIKQRKSRARKPKDPKASQKNFVQHKYRFQMTGTFLDLLKFLTSVENHSRFLQVDHIEIKPQGAKPKEKHADEVVLAENPIKDIVVEISTYTYSNTEQLAGK